MDHYPTISRAFHFANPYQQLPQLDLAAAIDYNTHRRLLELEIERYQLLRMHHSLEIMDPYANHEAYEADHVVHQQYSDLCAMAYGHPSLSELGGYQIPHDRPSPYRPPGSRTGGRTRRRHERRPAYQPGRHYPVKFITDDIQDEHDGSVLARMYNSDPQTAWKAASNLCSHHQTSPDEEFQDIVFFTDASARRITESKSDRDRGVNQWLKMRENPAEWRSGVAIAWDISPSSPLYKSSEQATSKAKDTGAWHLETDKITPMEGEWKAPNEAAYQVSGLQHFNQAELLGILFALERAVTIYRTYFHKLTNGMIDPSARKKLSRSITILTDSKPAMWDLTGSNWHTDSIRTDSEYWVLRQENTRKIVLQAKKYMKMLRSLKVEVRIQWVPGHNDIPGNEWVDGLSRVARLLPSRFGNNKDNMKEQQIENEDEKECEEDGWEDMRLSGVQRETIVDTGSSLFYNPFEVDSLGEVQGQALAAADSDSASIDMDSEGTVSSSTSDDGAGGESDTDLELQETPSVVSDDRGYIMVTRIAVEEVRDDIDLGILIPRLEELGLEDDLVELRLDELDE